MPPEQDRTCRDALAAAISVSPVLAVIRLHWRGHDLYSGLPALDALLGEMDLQQTSGSPAQEEARAFAAVDWAVHELTARWMTQLGGQLSDVPAVTSWPRLIAAIHALNRAVADLIQNDPAKKKMASEPRFERQVQTVFFDYKPLRLQPFAYAPCEGLSFLVETDWEHKRQAIRKAKRKDQIYLATNEAVGPYPVPEMTNADEAWTQIQQVAMQATAEFGRGEDKQAVAAYAIASAKMVLAGKIKESVRMLMLQASMNAMRSQLFNMLKEKLAGVAEDSDASFEAEAEAGDYYVKQIDERIKQMQPLGEALFRVLNEAS